jgi:hypothetical protein
VAFVDGHRSGWEAPAGGVLVPEYVVNFYSGEEFRGHFGCGRNFFETQRDGRGFFLKDVGNEDVAEFQVLIGTRE